MPVFTKHNTNPLSLAAEANGLAALNKVIKRANLSIKTPKVLTIDSKQMNLTWIDSCGGRINQLQTLGEDLALMHQVKQPYCGYHQDNYIGLNQQINAISHDWGTFFLEYRLKYQVEMMLDTELREEFKGLLEQCKVSLTEWLNQTIEHFSLLHGDLWTGNVLFDEQDVWLIDPAVYYGDSEADIAMTEMFGSFPAAFYQAYIQLRPLSEQYPLKKVIYNLYHQLNHYNLFGVGYLSACQQGFKAIKKNFS